MSTHPEPVGEEWNVRSAWKMELYDDAESLVDGVTLNVLKRGIVTFLNENWELVNFLRSLDVLYTEFVFDINLPNYMAFVTVYNRDEGRVEFGLISSGVGEEGGLGHKLYLGGIDILDVSWEVR